LERLPRYGKRQMAETVFSSIKRTLGEDAYSSKFENVAKEWLKVILHNKSVSF
jgi:hypothetical protein